MESYTTRTTCRACESHSITPLFSLGEQHINGFPMPGESYPPKCPIELVLCNNCTLVQLKHTAPSELLYTGHYWYRSGASSTMKAALKDVANVVEKLVKLQPGDIVLDIGSNDGTLLRSYSVPCHKVGFEPARNMTQHYDAKDEISLINDFWSAAVFDDIYQGAKAKVITALGMLYDLEDPNAFIRDVAKVLAADGVFIAQLMTLQNMVDMNDVGNLAHEHLEFYSIRSLRLILQKYGLDIFDIETNNVNGRSDRLFITWQGARPQTLRLVNRIKNERESGIHSPKLYEFIFQRWEQQKQRCVRLIEELFAGGMKIWGYGASTKGNTILQYYCLDDTMIEAVRDISPEKWGRTTLTGIPIKSPEEFRKEDPDYALVLPYAFLNEFVKDEVQWMEKGNKFIVPIPEVVIV